MFRNTLAALGRMMLTVATMAFLAGVSLFIVGSYLMTWPILRLSPRNRRLQVATQLASAVLATVREFTPMEMFDDDGEAVD